jgi:hypothetical protein
VKWGSGIVVAPGAQPNAAHRTACILFRLCISEGTCLHISAVVIRQARPEAGTQSLRASKQGDETSGGKNLRYDSGGQANKSIQTTGASSAVVVKAKSTYVSTSVQMKVLVNGVHTGTKTLPTSANKLVEYSYAADIPAGSHTISVVGVDLAGKNALMVH